MLVIDASIALAWCFKDEATPATDALVGRIHREGATVPAHWLLEVTNALLMAERRGRIPYADVTLHLRTIEALGIRVDTDTQGLAVRDALDLARREKLTLYDAAYLELAIRLNASLASLDRELRRAAGKTGVTAVP